MVINRPDGISFGSHVHVYLSKATRVMHGVMAPSLRDGKLSTSRHDATPQYYKHAWLTHCIICLQCVPKSCRDMWKSAVVNNPHVTNAFFLCWFACAWVNNALSPLAFKYQDSTVLLTRRWIGWTCSLLTAVKAPPPCVSSMRSKDDVRSVKIQAKILVAVSTFYLCCFCFWFAWFF